jgi:hypothetical protein
MLPVDIPTRAELLDLAAVRAPAAVSLYVETTPVTRDIGAARIAYGNAVRAALAQLDRHPLPRGGREALLDQLEDLGADDRFWAHQARSLAVLATPESLKTFRLANRVAAAVEVSDRFHLKPLLRALTFPHAGFVLALSENGARLVEFFADAPAVEVSVPGMPRDAASAVRQATINDRSHEGRIGGSEGKKVRLRQYARAVDAALRPVLAGSDLPLILAANAPLGPIFRSVAHHPHLLDEGIGEAVDRMSDAELAAAARPVLDASYAAAIAEMRTLYARRENEGRATADLSTAARAVVRGAVETLLVDMDATVPGTLDEKTGAITLAGDASASSYGVADQVAMLALGSGARVLSVRAADLPHPGVLAATLRFTI